MKCSERNAIKIFPSLFRSINNAILYFYLFFSNAFETIVPLCMTKRVEDSLLNEVFPFELFHFLVYSTLHAL